MTHANPYEPPRHSERDFTRTGVTLIPRQLATRTGKVVNRFGVFQLVWPISLAYWTDSFVLDLWALFIATNGLRVTPASFRRFPWTAVMCVAYPVALIISMQLHDPLDIWNWVPSRFSPVLSMQLFSAAWSLDAIYLIVKCHFAHGRTQAAEPTWI